MIKRKDRVQFDLKGKTAIVTGAGGSIGREIALEFAREGANVVCCEVIESNLQKTVDMIETEGGKGFDVHIDVSNWEQVQRMAQTTIERFGQIDLLYNVAGSFKYVGPIWEADPKVWWRDVTVNLYGSMLCCRAVLPYMIKRDTGIIINMDGGGGSNGPCIFGSGYGCSKVALLRFSEGLARELGSVGSSILVFCMMPGFVRSNLTEYLIATPERMKWMKLVKGLMGSDVELPPDACAKATMKLLRIASPELNGRIFYVDTDFEEIERRKAEIQKENLYVLYLITLEGRVVSWPLPKEISWPSLKNKQK